MKFAPFWLPSFLDLNRHIDFFAIGTEILGIILACSRKCPAVRKLNDAPLVFFQQFDVGRPSPLGTQNWK